MKIAINSLALILTAALAFSAHAKEAKKAAPKATKKVCVSDCKKNKDVGLETCKTKTGADKSACKKEARAKHKKCEEACPAK